MARRTKEEAAATRDSILDAAEKLFVEQGVSRTTLQHIASAAGVTRGAIYWHFDDKGALFNAMMERVTLPLEAEMQTLDNAGSADPLDDLRNYVLAVLRRTVDDPQARRVFEIATLKVEFLGKIDATTVLDDLRQFFVEIFRVTETNPQARRVLEIASLKVEFVSEMDAVRVRRRQSKGEMMEQVVERLKLAQDGGLIKADADPQLLATGLWALMG
jgi:TetR/AcrR family acrAB operon transcriptional repressor